METLHKERWFALLMGVTNTTSFIQKYSAIMDKLTELELQYKLANPDFDMDNMWTCCATTKGDIRFDTTRNCEDMVLMDKLHAIFDGVSM